MLTKNMATVDEYLQIWKVKLSTTKTVSSLPSQQQEAKRELKVKNNETLPFCSEPKFLGLTLDRSLTYRRHLESLRKKLTPRVALLRRLTGSGWGAAVTTLRIGTLALVHSTAEYCSPAWCHSPHTRLIDPAINDALRIVTGCLRPTPADNLPILARIQPAELRRSGATLFLAHCAMVPGHLLHSVLTCPSSANARRLKSRHAFVPAAQHLISLSGNNNIRAAQWADHQWITSCLYKWGMASSAACECGAEEQTVDDVVLQCPILEPPHGLHGLTVLDDETTEWLLNICPEI